MDTKNISLIIFFIILLSNQAALSQTILASKRNDFELKKIYQLTYKEKSVVKESWKSACSALGLFWTDNMCFDNARNVIWPQPKILCASGSLISQNSGQACDQEYTKCPDSSWELTTDRKYCYRSEGECHTDVALASEKQLLASIAYGEASTENIYEEMAAIASAIVRVRDTYKLTTINDLIKKHPNFSYVVSDGNVRFHQVMCSVIQANIELLMKQQVMP